MPDEVDLTITKTTAAVNPDGTVQLQLAVQNLGPDAATGVQVTDPLPSCATYVSDTCGASFAPPWTWAIGNLAASASASCTITVNASACAGLGPQSTTATVSGSQTETNAANNTDDSAFDIPQPVPTVRMVVLFAIAVLVLAAAARTLRRTPA